MLTCSAFLGLVGGVLLIAGSCVQQRRYTDTSTSLFHTHYDLYFYTAKTSRFGGGTTSALPDCLKGPYGAGMAFGIIGGVVALLGGLPLACLAVKFQTSPLRFIRPALLGGAAIFGFIAAMITAGTTKCDGVEFTSTYSLSTGFGLLIAGFIILVIATLMNVLQSSLCADARSATAAATQGQHPMVAFASSNAAPQHQHQQAGGAPVYNFASQQQQHQQPVMGQPAPYSYGGGPGVHQNDPYAASSHQQQQPMGYGSAHHKRPLCVGGR